jgi:hypothetical protein
VTRNKVKTILVTPTAFPQTEATFCGTKGSISKDDKSGGGLRSIGLR